MKNTHSATRRSFLQLATGAMAPLAGFTRFGQMNAYAQQAQDYKALVCIFLFGGCDGNNVLIPQSQQQFDAYKAARGSLALPDVSAKLLPVTAKNGTPYALSDGLALIQPFWAQNKLAAVANVGNLPEPTTRAQYLAGQVAVPTNLFSHSDQVVQMQTATFGGSGGTGWAGRLADQVQSMNGAATFPASVSMAGQQIFCAGDIVQSASLIPGFDMSPTGFTVWPATSAAARMTALQEILSLDSGMALVQAANKVRQDALSLSSMLKGLNGTPFATQFPGTDLGNQLKQVAQIIKLRGSTGMKRQVFFCSLGGFDTHSAQAWQHWDLLKQLAAAMQAFYLATEEMGIADKVTLFTESEFGRTLQPSGNGSDHGWGSHFLVLGGAVQGGDVFGTFPQLALGGPDDAGTRGALLPTTSLDQYGATMAKWFGVPPIAMETVFPSLKKFSVKDLGFMGS
jgi:uncharacterized protein (DUF1501 family)